MKTYVCANCGVELKRPTPPLSCQSCGQQRIGLFKEKPAGAPAAPASPGGQSFNAPPPPGAPAAPVAPLIGGAPPPPGAPATPVAPAPASPTPAPRPSAPQAPAAPAPPTPQQPIAPAPAPPAAPASPTPVAAAPAPPTTQSIPQAPTPPAPAETVSPDGDETPAPVPQLPPSVNSPKPADAPAQLPPSTPVESVPPRPSPRPAPRPSAPPTVPAFEPPTDDEAEDEAAPSTPTAKTPPAAPTPKLAPPAPAPQPAPTPTAATPDPPAAPTPTPQPATPKPKPAAEKKVPGKVMWQYPKQIPGQAYSTMPLRGCPVAFDKSKFAACMGDKLIAFEWKGSGLAELWECELGGHVPASPVLGPDGLIRVHSGDGWLHCIDQNGERVWEPVPVGEPLGWSSPAVDLNNNTYVSSYAGGILRIGPRGEFKSTKPFLRTRQKFDSTGLLYRGTLYIGCEDAFVHALPVSQDTGTNAWDQLEDRGKTSWFINSAPALGSDTTIVVAGRDENLYGFHEDGTLAWKLYIPGQMLASPVVAANGDVLVGVSLVRSGQRDRGKLVCVDGESHRIRWEFDAQGPVESTPVIGDDQTIYFGDNAGNIHGLRGDGHPQWRQNVRFPVRSAGHIVGPNRLVFGLDNGTMVGLLCSSGGVEKKGWPKYMAR